MLIEVTQEDIKGGRRRQCMHCPVHLALKRAGFGDLAVTILWVFSKRDDCDPKWQWDALGLDFVSHRIRAYDQAGQMTPFSFHLSAECAMI